ncbi:DUF5701 family protein [Nocardioides daphniae]|uniref:Uncharacterized protein n=1 Tax=Nocardioides daphniae TaxID=402297 RepID=A0A4P7U7P8_9ACTN|nr:DUF5701 family protein [Nocardioides daphniae]QCC76172.1 hypothetical protein E2C04_01270 [Nocardioides daphniae]GGD09380.1 hypothetical protein GCM10007231_05300 [Nocardioides daphniae]
MTADLRTTVHTQAERLVALGVPALAGLSEEQLRALLAPLAELDVDLTAYDDGPGAVPCLVVLPAAVVRPDDTVPLLRLGDRPGFVDRHHGDEGLAPYRPVPGLDVPAAPYLLLGFDRGEEFRDVAPEDALPVITARNRTPVTVEEGVAAVLQVPTVLEKNRCFMLSGSRRVERAGDRRVPALWISERAPKLGWCWDGNPHSWLGVASAARRVEAPPAP